MKQPLYQILANFVFEYEGCETHCIPELAAKIKARIEELVREYMPQNIHIWRPYQLCFERSESDRLVFKVEILNKLHLIAVEPSLRETFKLTFGPNRLDGGQYHFLMQALLTPHEEALV